MPKTPVLLVTILALAIGGSLIAATTPETPDAMPNAFGFEVELAPLADHPDGYRCNATIRDLDTGEVLASPRLVFPKGQNATAEATLAGSGQTAVLDVHVTDSDTLVYELEIRTASQVVARHSATVALAE